MEHRHSWILRAQLSGSMSQNDNAGIYWLILATSISSMTTAVLYLFQKCCGTCWGNMGHVFFQFFARSLELREETFYRVTNLLIFPRIFQQLELQTFKVVWNHDANAQTGDFVQYGWLRLPTRSYVLTFLAVCGVTHYVYIPYDLKSVQIVGPSNAIQILIDLSNMAATSALEESQIVTLREAFGMENTWTTADKVCVLCEVRVAVTAGIVFCLWFAHVFRIRWVFSIGLILVSAMVAIGVWYQAHEKCRGLARDLFRRYRSPIIDDMEVSLTSAPDLELHEALSGVLLSHRDSPVSVEFSTATMEVNEAVELNNMVYSLLLARGHYFEVLKQSIVIPQADAIVCFAAEARMYAVQVQPNFVQYLAERTCIPDNALLHICLYNPFVDPYLTEMYQNFQKGVDRENCLVVVLPPLGNFDASLETCKVPRTRTASSTQFVGTLSDYEMLLLQITTGLLVRKLVFIFPIDEDILNIHAVSQCSTWKASVRVLGESNCFWPARS